MHGQLFLSELRIHLRQRSLWLGLPAMAAFGFVLTNGLRIDQDLSIASHFHLFNLQVVLLMMTLPFVISVLGMTAFLRDSSHRFIELSYSVPLAARTFVLGRLVGLVATASLVIIAAQLGTAAGIAVSSLQPVSAVQLGSYLLWDLFVVALPAILLYSATYLLLGTVTRNALALHFSMLVLFIAYMLFATKSGSPVIVSPGLPNPLLVRLMLWFDPFAMAPVAAQAAELSIAARNSSFVALDGQLLLNRLGVLLIAIVILTFTIRRFALRLPHGKRTNKRHRRQESMQTEITAYAASDTRTGWLAQWHAFRSLCRIEYLATLKSHLFLLIIAVWALVIGGEVFPALTWLEPMATRVPGTADALNRFQWDIVPQFGMLILLLVSSDIAWRDRHLGISSLVAATPAGNVVLLASKWLTLVLLVVTLLLVSVALAVLAQFAHASPIDAGLYLTYFYYAGVPLALVATLCLGIHCLSPNRTTGMAICIAVLAIALTPLGNKLGLEHPLLHFAQSPLRPWSGLIGYSATSSGFHGFMLFWLTVAALVVVLGFGLFHRGVPDNRGWRQLRGRPLWAVSSVAAFLLAIAAGWRVDALLRQDAYFQTSAQQNAWKAAYERQFGRYRNAPFPVIKHASYEIDLYPGERRLQVAAVYTLANRHAVPLTEVLVSTHMDAQINGMELAGAELDEVDNSFGQYRFTFEPAMRPGETRELHFTATLAQNGYGEVRSHLLLAPGFSYLRTIPYLPALGYVEPYEITDNAVRRSLGLPERPEPESLEQSIRRHAGNFSGEYDWLTTDTVIATDANETGIAQGELQREWREGGRRFFQFRTAAPIRNVVGFVSGEFEVRRRQVNGIDLEVYFKAGHGRNVEHMLDAMTDAVRYLSEQVGTYPYKQLRLVESAVYDLTGYAMPQTLLIGEGVGFQANLDNPDGFDHVYRRTVHEVSHQWFGHGIGNGVAADGAFLVESLAKYAELVLLAQKHGTATVKRLVDYELGRYQGGVSRATEAERPLVLADETHLVYSKASVVFFQLLEAFGEEPINRTLQTLWQRHRYPQPPATSLDFARYLKEQAAVQHHALIDDLLLAANSGMLRKTLADAGH